MQLVWKILVSAVLGLAVLHGPAAAQCPLPDGLDGGPCCTVTGLKLPPFPNFNQDALDICWRDCNVDQVFLCQARWSLVPILVKGGCGERRMNLDLSDATGPKWHGTLTVLYSRTWLELDPGGNQLQVWRFLVNGDMTPVGAAMTIPCPVPPCAPAFGGRVRFTGYLDYARNCNSPLVTYQKAWMLTHTCDFIDHHAGFPRAGAFHPDRSYTFVGPAAGFVPGAIQPTEGTPGSPFEVLRRRRFPPLGAVGPIVCEYEDPLFHRLTPIQQICLCGAPAAPPQFLIADMLIDSACGTVALTPVGGGPFLPGYISMGIGAWTLPAVYPGLENLRWNAAGYDYIDACPPVTTTREVFFGVTTLNGYPALQLLSGGPGAPLPLTFIDQSNSIRANTQTTVMNIPYVSKHILNLNH